MIYTVASTLEKKMTIDFREASVALPAAGVRVLLQLRSGKYTFGRLTIHGWRDDQSLPVSVTRWAVMA